MHTGSPIEDCIYATIESRKKTRLMHVDTCTSSGFFHSDDTLPYFLIFNHRRHTSASWNGMYCESCRRTRTADRRIVLKAIFKNFQGIEKAYANRMFYCLKYPTRMCHGYPCFEMNIRVRVVQASGDSFSLCRTDPSHVFQHLLRPYVLSIGTGPSLLALP